MTEISLLHSVTQMLKMSPLGCDKVGLQMQHAVLGCTGLPDLEPFDVCGRVD